MSHLLKVWVISGAILLLLAGFALSGTTGKIAGKVTDAATGEPVPGVNIVLDGTTRGAATDLDGVYYIINIAPGTYSLQVSAVGYAVQNITDIKVNVDVTSTVDIELSEQVVAGEEVTFIARRPKVKADRTFSTASVDATDLEIMPVTNTQEVVDLQAGVVDGHFRGGRSGEVVYMLDGIPIQDVYDNTQSTKVNQDVVQELQVITGTFNAEYGQAMSGVVNLVTKDGGDEYHGMLGAQIGDYYSNHSNEFDYIDNIDPTAIQNYDFSLSGPTPFVKKLKFFVNARLEDNEGWMYGRRKYDPDFIDQWVAWGEYYESIFENNNPVVAGQLADAFMDSLGWDPDKSDTDNFAAMLDKWGRSDNEAVPMNPNENLYLFGKLSYDLTDKLKLSVTSLWDDREYMDFDRDYLQIPEGDYKRFRNARTNNVKLLYAVNQSMFMEFGYSNNFIQYQHYVYEDINDPRYNYDYYGFSDTNPSYTLKMIGVKYEHFRRYTNTHVVQGKASWQVNPVHYVQAGLNYNINEVFYRSINDDIGDIGPTIPEYDGHIPPVSDFNHDHYLYDPIEYAGYIQDKIELKNLVINIGVRYDYFNSNGKVLRYPKDPDVYHPVKEGYYTDANSIQHLQPLSQRLNNWYIDPSAKTQFSPRLGIGYPISERGVLHFAYGHFFQRPRYEYLYANPEFEIKRQGAGLHTVMGNADLEAEKTISYEFGFDQALTPDLSIGVSIYQRDIRGLVAADLIVETNSPGVKYAQYTNRDIAEVKGIILKLDQRYSGNISYGVDYTFQVAKGIASDPQDVYNAQNGDDVKEPIKQLIPLDWDRRHTLNVNFNYIVPQKWGVSVIGTIGSGTPFTIETGSSVIADLGLSFENDGRKPTYMNVDLSGYYVIPYLSGSRFNARLEFMVRNLLDRLNENDVFKDTGRATYRTDIQEGEYTDITSTDTYWLYYPQYYSRPREVRIGINFTF